MKKLKNLLSGARLLMTTILVRILVTICLAYDTGIYHAGLLRHKYRESINITVWLFMLVYFPYIARLFDPSAASLDLGVISFLIFGVIRVIVCKYVTWYLIKMLWPDFAFYFANDFANDFNTLKPWQRLTASLLFYSGLCLYLFQASSPHL